MIELIKENWIALTGVISSVIAFFGGRKMKKAEENKSTADALTSMQQTYDSFVTDFRERYNELKEEIKTFRDEQMVLRTEITQLRAENDNLRKELRIWEKKYKDLKVEFDNHRNATN